MYRKDAVKREHLRPQPARQSAAPGAGVVGDAVHVACGDYHTFVVRRDAAAGATAVYGSGLNNYGQLGRVPSNVP